MVVRFDDEGSQIERFKIKQRTEEDKYSSPLLGTGHNQWMGRPVCYEHRDSRQRSGVLESRRMLRFWITAGSVLCDLCGISRLVSLYFVENSR